MKKTLLIVLGLIFSISLFVSKTVIAQDRDCEYREDGIVVCRYEDEKIALFCNARMRDEAKLEECRERIRESNRERKFYRKKYKKECRHPWNKRGEYCQELKETYSNIDF